MPGEAAVACGKGLWGDDCGAFVVHRSTVCYQEPCRNRNQEASHVMSNCLCWNGLKAESQLQGLRSLNPLYWAAPKGPSREQFFIICYE